MHTHLNFKFKPVLYSSALDIKLFNSVEKLQLLPQYYKPALLCFTTHMTHTFKTETLRLVSFRAGKQHVLLNEQLI